MGGEQAAGVLALVEREKRAREGREWPADEEEYFRERIRGRCVLLLSLHAALVVCYLSVSSLVCQFFAGVYPHVGLTVSPVACGSTD